MDQVNKVYQIIGMATRARRLVSGEETCEREIRSGRARLCIVTEDASDNTKKKFENLCSHKGLRLIFWGEKELLGKFTGKNVRAVIAIKDDGFAGKIQGMLENF